MNFLFSPVFARIAGPLLVASLFGLTSTAALPQAYPAKPIRMIVPFAAGGGADISSRILAAALAERVGQPVVVENRGGAGSNIGMEAGARAAPDGYTITVVISSLVANPFLYKMAFDVDTDIIPVSHLWNYDLILVVHPTFPANSVTELIALAKSKPDTLTFGSSGAGSSSHIAPALLMSKTGIKLVHVPYKGTGPAQIDLLSGQISLLFNVTSDLGPLIRSGKLKALGIASPKRSGQFPGMPAIAESVPGYEFLGWYGVFVPAKTPPERVELLSREIAAALNTPQVKQRLVDLGLEVVGSTPEQFNQLIKKEKPLYGKLIRDAGIKAEN